MKPPMQVVVCGSMQFASKFVALQQRLAELGHKAYIPTPKIDQRAHPAAGDEQANSLHMKRRQVMLAHFAQIEQADVILVANYEKNGIPGYIGISTMLEMGVAAYLGRPIYLLYPVPAIDYADEIYGMQPLILDGDLMRIG